MLVHLRLNVPTALSADVVDLLLHEDRSANLTVHHGASLSPVGDLIECDVARELAGEVIGRLKQLGLHESGGIVVTTPTATPFAAARRLERAAPGDPDDAVIWDTVIEQCYAASRPTVSYYIFFVLASLLAAIAVITDSAVLVVGAMVVGPEFGTVAAVAVGLVFGRFRLVVGALRLLATGILISIVVVAVLGLLAGLTGLVTADMVTRPRPQTGFIWHPDRWSFIVALIAGAAGVLAMTTARANAMVGVFISVTTIPAVGNLALAIGVWAPSEMRGSAAQLAVNLLGMVVAGMVVVALQRLLWVRTLVAAQRLFNRVDQRQTR
ncbi:uncharacterized hydrophobic domain-containing protein [Nocardioides alpinus]|uniref:DUF389 domain-containing protein n=1 Tax=Nocardioides alpinus TaxID=748909 RepID=A0A1I0VDB5_9ACTN|nr:DUF389 domain-containing protein [Nocardioides alpinus]PKH37213.1 DUF389 domain-containing protein [Nocardioides alpinus]SFA74355.1 uncharacterized hydrophobic domain-containing protein [Nocardioides alpinus]